MKILLTGGYGFLGRYVYDKLIASGYNDTKIFRSKEYDLRDKDQTLKLVDSYKPDAVIHLAATVGGIGANMKNPGVYFYENMVMGLNLIESSRVVGINKFVQVGTVCSYPKYCAVPFREDDLWEGYPEETNAPYGVAKKALYVMLEAYKKQYNFNSTILIPCNLYGPYDNFNPDSSHVIPALIKKVAEAKEYGDNGIECWGTGSATREFLYAEDAAEAIVKSIKIDTAPSPINLGTGEDISIKNLIDTICSVMDYNGTIVWDTSKPDGQPRRKLDVSLSNKILGWKAKTQLRDGLQKTIEWYLRRST
jgi:GDP-L-fucose synthase